VTDAPDAPGSERLVVHQTARTVLVAIPLLLAAGFLVTAREDPTIGPYDFAQSQPILWVARGVLWFCVVASVYLASVSLWLYVARRPAYVFDRDGVTFRSVRSPRRRFVGWSAVARITDIGPLSDLVPVPEKVIRTPRWATRQLGGQFFLLLVDGGRESIQESGTDRTIAELHGAASHLLERSRTG